MPDKRRTPAGRGGRPAGGSSSRRPAPSTRGRARGGRLDGRHEREDLDATRPVRRIHDDAASTDDPTQVIGTTGAATSGSTPGASGPGGEGRTGDAAARLAGSLRPPVPEPGVGPRVGLGLDRGRDPLSARQQRRAGRLTPAQRLAAARGRTPRWARRLARPSTKPTGRLAVLLVVVAVLVVSFASSARAYLEQRATMDALRTEIAHRQASIDQLEEEKARWKDPAYLEQQARARFGYVKRGETSYIVIGKDGKPLGQAASGLADPRTVGHQAPPAWWSSAWGSVELAGDPPRSGGAPASEIDGSQKGADGSGG